MTERYRLSTIRGNALGSSPLRRLRFEHGEMTQQELANRAGCTRQTIVLLEQGRYVPSLAFRIARTFGATVEDVFEWTESEGER